MVETANGINWTDIVSAIANLGSAVALVIALIIALTQVRAINKARQNDALTGWSRRWVEEPLEQARLAVQKIGDARQMWNQLAPIAPGQSEEWFLFMRIPTFFEELGSSTLHGKVLKVELVYELFGTPIEHYWGSYGAFIQEYRNKMEDERLFEWFERLATEMAALKEKRQ